MRKIIVIALTFLMFAGHGFCTDADYKQVLISNTTNSIRVRLPLTDVTGKVRVKEHTVAGLGAPVAPTRANLGQRDYLEWQISYDAPDTNSPTAVPWLQFQRHGETKYGHELSKIIFEAVRIGLLSTNDLTREMASLQEISPADFEESQPVQLEVETNRTTSGFQRAVQRVPEFTKTTPHGWVQIQLKQKQRAVGYQAMVYVCLPLNEVLTMAGTPRPPGPAKSKETVYYDFTHENKALLIDIIQAFGLASQQHNEDLRQILKVILETFGSR